MKKSLPKKQKGGPLGGSHPLTSGPSSSEKPATKKQVRQEKRKARPTRTDKKFNKAVRNHPLI